MVLTFLGYIFFTVFHFVLMFWIFSVLFNFYKDKLPEKFVKNVEDFWKEIKSVISDEISNDEESESSLASGKSRD